MDLELETNDGEIITIQNLIDNLKNQIKEKQDFFINKDGKMQHYFLYFSRPGIIVLINDSDWEIYEKDFSVLQDGDTISFISTLHGG